MPQPPALLMPLRDITRAFLPLQRQKYNRLWNIPQFYRRLKPLFFRGFQPSHPFDTIRRLAALQPVWQVFRQPKGKTTVLQA